MFIIIKENQKRINHLDIRKFHWKDITVSDLNSDRFEDFAKDFILNLNGKILPLKAFINLFTDLWNLNKTWNK